MSALVPVYIGQFLFLHCSRGEADPTQLQFLHTRYLYDESENKNIFPDKIVLATGIPLLPRCLKQLVANSFRFYCWLFPLQLTQSANGRSSLTTHVLLLIDYFILFNLKLWWTNTSVNFKNFTIGNFMSNSFLLFFKTSLFK